MNRLALLTLAVAVPSLAEDKCKLTVDAADLPVSIRGNGNAQEKS
jgi:hypothetical protein